MGSPLWVQPEQLGQFADYEFAFEACKTASYLLWGMSGRKYSGVTSVTEIYRYVPQTIPLEKVFEVPTRGALTYDLITHPYQPRTYVVLRGRPALSVSTVRTSIDSQIVGPTDPTYMLTTVSPADYYMTDHSVLNFRYPHYNEDIEVSYTYGSQPPVAGRMAARTLAQELCMAWDGDANCSLPDRVTSIARQGVTYTVMDPETIIQNGHTGLTIVDMFLSTVNPARAFRKAKVFSPDLARGNRYTAKTFELPASANDITLNPNGVSPSTLTLTLSTLSATYLNDPGWTAEVQVNSYGAKYSVSLQNAYTISEDGTTITISIPYSSAVPILGQVDPGTWDLYGIYNGASSFITSGNLSVKLI